MPDHAKKKEVPVDPIHVPVNPIQAKRRSAGVPPAVTGASRPRFGTVTIRNRGRLPHWEVERGVYFVTFRLRDSLPEAVTRRIVEHRKMLEDARRSGRKLLESEEKLAAELSTKKIEAYLDAGSGGCVLARPELAEAIAGALRFWDSQRYRLLVWCVMPNHVHAIMCVLTGYSLAQVVGGWKSFTAKKVNRLLGRTGSIWQREYYDRLIRDGSEFERAVKYVINNPARAGLSGWRWVWAAEEILDSQ